MGALQAIIFVNLFGYLAVAYLAGLLAAKLHQVDVKLKYTSGALEDLQALHENIIQSISGGLITTGLDGYITLANPAAQKLFERSESEFLGQAVGSSFLTRCPSRFRTRPWRSALCGGKRLLQDPAGDGDGSCRSREKYDWLRLHLR
jgi:PAS domain-containing protein